MIFKLLVVGGAIYWLYRWMAKPEIEAPQADKQEDEWIDYEEIE